METMYITISLHWTLGSMDGSSVHDEILYGSTFSPLEVTLQRYRFLDSALRLKKYSDSFSIVSHEASCCPYKWRIATVTMNTPFMGRPRKPSIEKVRNHKSGVDKL